MPTSAPAPDLRWRTRDIVVAAVIGVAFGVAFFVAGGLWSAIAGLGPAQNLFYGVWLLPAIVAPLIIRKPGAALFAEVVAASLSALLGSLWGVDTLLSGIMQGAAAELVFALTRYRSYAFPIAGRGRARRQRGAPSSTTGTSTTRATRPTCCS